MNWRCDWNTEFNGKGNKVIDILTSGWMRSIVVESNNVDNEVNKDCNNVQAPLLEESGEADILSGEKGPEGKLDHVVMIPVVVPHSFERQTHVRMTVVAEQIMLPMNEVN